MKVGLTALLIACPVAVLAAVVWWELTLAVSAVAVAFVIEAHWRSGRAR